MHSSLEQFSLIVKVYQVCSNDGRGLTFVLFYSKVTFAPPYICMGKMLKNGFLGMYQTLMAETYTVRIKK